MAVNGQPSGWRVTDGVADGGQRAPDGGWGVTDGLWHFT